jgi:hypothetical protein
MSSCPPLRSFPVAVAALVCCLSVTTFGQEIAKDKDVIKVTANQIAKEFWDNDKLAVKKYSGKTVEVEGKVGEKLHRFFGNDLWQLVLKSELKSKNRVCFDFIKDSPEFVKAEKLNLKVGQVVTIRGTCDGGNQYSPKIKDCSVVSPK